MKLSQAIREFLEDCELAKGLAKRTIENYSHYLGRFLDFAGEKTVSEIDDPLVRKWRLELNSTGTLSKSSQNYHLVALRAFLGWLAQRGLQSLPPEKVDLPGSDSVEVSFLSSKVVEQLLATPNPKTKLGKRDLAVLEVLFSTGVRVSELVSLDRKDVEGKQEVSVLGKGRKRRVVFLSPRAEAAIKNYLSTRHDDDPALFTRNPNRKGSQKNLRLTARTIQRIINRYATEAGIADRVTPHTLRHTFATDLLQAGADLRSVQSMLGHSSVVTTQRYTHLTDQHLKDVHDAFHGRRRKTD